MNFIKYLFKIIPGQQFAYYIPMITLIIALIIGSAIFSRIYKIRKKEDIAFKKLFKKLPEKMLLFAILFTFLVLVRYENIPYFSMRIWLYLSLGWFIHFAYRTANTYRKIYPQERENHQKKTKVIIKEKNYTTKKKRKHAKA